MGTMQEGAKFERKYLMHYIDASFGGSANYVRLGKDLEEYNVNMNAEVEEKTNILGESSVTVKGYKPDVSVDTYYATKGDPLYEHLFQIINNQSTGSAVETSIVDILVEEDGTQVWAYRQGVVVVPQTFGGQGNVNISFQIKYNGTRESGTWNNTTKTFTAGE